jgi:phage tail-like protein
MREKLKYFILNNAYEFRRGICENMAVSGNTLRFSSDRLSGIGRFMTRIFDSGDRGTTWHRMLINAADCSADELRVTVYAADDPEFSYRGVSYTIDEVFHDKSIDLAKKTEMFSVFEKKRINGAKDALLHDVSGRYLWIYIDVFGISEKPAVINDIRLYLPAESWIDRLPQIYRKADKETGFLERYLGIFQTLYDEVEDEIDRISARFDPECAESGFLEWLAGWLDISDCSVWKEDKLRKLLLSAVSLYRSRGTRESLSRAIELYTGERPFIIENFSLREHIGTSAYEHTLVPMYGNDPYKIFILVRSEVVGSDSDKDILWRIAREMMPVTVDFELKVLEPYIFLDQYSYLGINTYLGKPGNAALDGRSRITFSVLGE